MLNMSFYDGSLNREEAYEVVKNTDKSLLLREGFTFRGATAKAVDRDEALLLIEHETCLSIREEAEQIILNTFSSNDMW